MSAFHAVSFVLALLLLGYLFAVLFKAEIFS